jgi:hypothetical protein
MDPTANLIEQEQIIMARDEARRTVDSNETPYQSHRAARLRELREALIDWLNGGGFAPDWSKAPKARKYFKR